MTTYNWRVELVRDRGRRSKNRIGNCMLRKIGAFAFGAATKLGGFFCCRLYGALSVVHLFP